MILLFQAAAQNKRFKVLVTEARPHSKGQVYMVILFMLFYAHFVLLVLWQWPSCKRRGFQVGFIWLVYLASLILDAAVGHVIEQVDFVLVGAGKNMFSYKLFLFPYSEAVVQNGGVINQIGTYQMAVVGIYFIESVNSYSLLFVNLLQISQSCQ